MPLHKIDSFKELEREKNRLKAELQTAKEGVKSQLNLLPLATKQQLTKTSSISTIVTGLASIGISKIVSKERAKAFGVSKFSDPNTWQAQVSSVLKGLRESPTETILSLLPALMPYAQKLFQSKAEEETDPPPKRSVSAPVLPHERPDLVTTEQETIHEISDTPPLKTKTPPQILVGKN